MSKTVKEAMQETFALAKLPNNLPTVLSYYNTMNWLGSLTSNRGFDKTSFAHTSPANILNMSWR